MTAKPHYTLQQNQLHYNITIEHYNWTTLQQNQYNEEKLVHST